MEKKESIYRRTITFRGNKIASGEKCVPETLSCGELFTDFSFL